MDCLEITITRDVIINPPAESIVVLNSSRVINNRENYRSEPTFDIFLLFSHLSAGVQMTVDKTSLPSCDSLTHGNLVDCVSENCNVTSLSLV